MKKIRLGTRGSALALTQSNFIARQMKDSVPDVEIEIVIVKTKGDIIRDVPLSQVQGQGFFVKEIETSLEKGEIDIAVHSAKDLPTKLAPGMILGAISEREDPRDCLVSRENLSFDRLPRGASIATSALRRQALIAHLRPDLTRVELRGNVDTRLRKLDEGQFDALIIARAALKRLGHIEKIAETFDMDRFVPAVAQGALAIESREADREINEILSTINHRETHAALEAERTLLETTQGGCQIPLGAHCKADPSGHNLVIKACVVSPDGKVRVDAQGQGPIENPIELGSKVAKELLEKGGEDVLRKIRKG